LTLTYAFTHPSFSQLFVIWLANEVSTRFPNPKGAEEGNALSQLEGSIATNLRPSTPDNLASSCHQTQLRDVDLDDCALGQNAQLVEVSKVLAFDHENFWRDNVDSTLELASTNST
jgi:hypothetical protein